MLTNQTIDPTRQHTPDRWHPLLRPFARAWEWLVPSSVAARDRQSPLARYVALFLIVSFSVSILIAAILYAKPIQDSWQSSRAQSMIREAEELMENGQATNAFWKAQEAYNKAPHNIDAIRYNAKIFVNVRPETTLWMQEQLEEKGAATTADKILRIRALWKLNRSKEAEAEMEALLKEDATNPELLKLAEELSGGKTPKPGMLRFMQEFVAQNPNDTSSQLRLAKAQVASNLPSQISQGLDTAWKLAQTDDATGLEALEFLDSVPVHPVEIAEKYIQRLKEHPKGDDRHQIAALRREVKLYPDRKSAIIADAVARYRDKKRDALVPFITFLKEEEQFLEIVTLVTEEDAKTHQGLLENYLTALTMLKRFEQIERIVEDPAVAKILDPTTHAMFRAHLAFVTGKPAEEFRARLITAKDMAERNARFTALQRIAEYAEARSHFDIAEDAYRLAVMAARRAATPQSPLVERAALKGLIKACEQNGHSESYFNACRDAVIRFPEDSDFLDKALYISLLVGHEVENSLKKAGNLLKAQPKDHHRRLMMALANWRLYDFERAKDFLQYMDLNLVSEGQRAVFAAIADSAGFHEQALSVVKAISPKAVMFPEERACYQRVFAH
ncbi:MAG: hypothetical protein JNG86_06560 [Verrucomicrobiaceae bacterium]|nr:hypothetical protein [Verrucomicrobiaceae bacterium]